MAQLLYFSKVREKIGIGDETIKLPDTIATVADLVAHLRGLGEGYKSALADMAFIRVAINQNHVGIDHAVTNADEIAFFPPVTGG
ncbi:MAG: molybdopterin converting factor subunit 1 [Kordiimonadaceae bacterium]|nr:molybdopterin converting factor subunit 1 [Kordiimonadaceae bacterium]